MNLIKDIESMIFHNKQYNNILCCYGSSLDYFFNQRNIRILNQILIFIQTIQYKYSEDSMEQIIKYIFGDEDIEISTVNCYKDFEKINDLRNEYARKNII